MKKKILLISLNILIIILVLLLGITFGYNNKFNQSISTNLGVVNLDQGVQIEDKFIYYGKDFLNHESIQENKNFDILDYKIAKEKFTNKEYGALIILPENFSKSIESINFSPEKIKINYILNNNLVQKDIFEFCNNLNNLISLGYNSTLLDKTFYTLNNYNKINNNLLENNQEIESIINSIHIEPIEIKEAELNELNWDIYEENIKELSLFKNNINSQLNENVLTEKNSDNKKIIDSLNLQNQQITDLEKSDSISIIKESVDLIDNIKLTAFNNKNESENLVMVIDFITGDRYIQTEKNKKYFINYNNKSYCINLDSDKFYNINTINNVIHEELNQSNGALTVSINNEQYIMQGNKINVTLNNNGINFNNLDTVKYNNNYYKLNHFKINFNEQLNNIFNNLKSYNDGLILYKKLLEIELKSWKEVGNGTVSETFTSQINEIFKKFGDNGDKEYDNYNKIIQKLDFIELANNLFIPESLLNKSPIIPQSKKIESIDKEFQFINDIEIIKSTKINNLFSNYNTNITKKINYSDADNNLRNIEKNSENNKETINENHQILKDLNLENNQIYNEKFNIFEEDVKNKFNTLKGDFNNNTIKNIELLNTTKNSLSYVKNGNIVDLKVMEHINNPLFLEKINFNNLNSNDNHNFKALIPLNILLILICLLMLLFSKFHSR